MVHAALEGMIRVPQLDGLRGIAILLVLAGHIFQHSTLGGAIPLSQLADDREPVPRRLPYPASMRTTNHLRKHGQEGEWRQRTTAACPKVSNGEKNGEKVFGRHWGEELFQQTFSGTGA